MAKVSANDVAVVQSIFFGDTKGNKFNDLETVIGYPANITINVNNPIVEMTVVHCAVLDGLEITYLRDDGQTVDVTHGTSEKACLITGTNLTKDKITFNDNENIVAVTGKHGYSSSFGTRITQIKFVIYDSSTGTMRTEGPFGWGNGGKAFRVTANGHFVAFGGYSVDTNSSIGQVQNAGKAGGLYGLTFSEIAYTEV